MNRIALQQFRTLSAAPHPRTDTDVAVKPRAPGRRCQGHEIPQKNPQKTRQVARDPAWSACHGYAQTHGPAVMVATSCPLHVGDVWRGPASAARRGEATAAVRLRQGRTSPAPLRLPLSALAPPHVLRHELTRSRSPSLQPQPHPASGPLRQRAFPHYYPLTDLLTDYVSHGVHVYMYTRESPSTHPTSSHGHCPPRSELTRRSRSRPQSLFQKHPRGRGRGRMEGEPTAPYFYPMCD